MSLDIRQDLMSFELWDGGHCYLRAHRGVDHVTLKRFPERITAEMLSALGRWTENGMWKKEVLELLREIFEGAAVLITDSDDASGLNTQYLVDQQQVLANIDVKLEELDTKDE